ncbi:MAG TPA: PucR family transcriptional regulator ligand-binding domain-containing protein [Blastocatellia bacterium]|jgi:sugar diacid utilization regulator|nr:PucR family transcriptional regulator ligand-binding domain-containing protein [Blastocatellia bacterium]
MSLTVREALSLNVLKDAKVVAGDQGLDNPIRWTHIIDHPDITKWVKGGELLITSGLGIYNDTQAQITYMSQAVEKKIAAVFVTVQEYLPQTTPQMREIANRAGMPLVELPRTIAFIEITEAILRKLAARSLNAEKDYLIDALLAGNLLESEETLARLRGLGLEPEQYHALVLTQKAGESFEQSLSDEESRDLMGVLNRAPRRAMMACLTNWVLAIFPLGTREESSVPFAHTLDAALREQASEPIRVGVGRLVRKMSDFPTSYREAQDALFIAGITRDESIVKHYNDLGVWRLLLRTQESELQRFADYYLSPVARHDREHQTGWLTTLETFLDRNGNLRATARALNLHRNTITYQIERISQLLGRRLDDPEARLNLQLALRARRLLKARNKSTD